LLRENQRFWFDRLLDSLQRVLRWLGADLVRQGHLEHPDQVALLTWPELQSAARGRPGDLGGWVTRRAVELEANRAEQPPVFLVGDGPPPPPSGATRLQGLGVSAGRARGRVRIVRSPADADRLQPGEVLVAVAVDPGWTPLFSTAAAVVLELGSVLSHGAVVAREYELPAVANVDRVTQRLRDGQEVTVDGTRGTVFLHP
jgi:phosphohistidine swiveling domain-containing protein